MNAQVIAFPVDKVERHMCWPCVAIWCGMPTFWVFVFWLALR